MSVELTKLPLPPEVREEAAELTRLAHELFRGVGELTIETQDEFEMAGDWAKKISKLRRETEAAKKARRDPYNSILNLISDEYEAPLKVLRTAEQNLDGGLKAYILAERKRQEDLNRKREEERRAEIQRALKAEEEARRAAAEAHATHQAAVAADDPELMETTTDLLEVVEARREESAARFDRAAELSVPVQSYQPVKGVHTREVWFARVVDEAALPREYMLPDTAKLDRIAKAVKGPSTIPGVEFYAETTVVKTNR